MNIIKYLINKKYRDKYLYNWREGVATVKRRNEVYAQWEREQKLNKNKPSVPKVVTPVEKKIVIPEVVNLVEPVVTPVNKVLEWFLNKDIEVSPAEKIISDLLKLYKVEWYREVSFKSFQSSKYGYYRFDFFLPKLGLIIEYDSIQWHNSPDRISVDQIKDSWCWNNGLTIKRFSNKEYYSMATHIDKLMLSHRIYRR